MKPRAAAEHQSPAYGRVCSGCVVQASTGHISLLTAQQQPYDAFYGGLSDIAT